MLCIMVGENKRSALCCSGALNVCLGIVGGKALPLHERLWGGFAENI